MIFISWLLAIGALVLVGRRYARSNLVVALLVALLVANPALLDATGMAVTNNFIATPFALFGLLAFIEAARRPVAVTLAGGARRLSCWPWRSGSRRTMSSSCRRSPLRRSSPLRTWPMRTRLTAAYAAAAGGRGSSVGRRPCIFSRRIHPAFSRMSCGLHRGPQIGYWVANADPLDPKAIGSGRQGAPGAALLG